MTSIFKEQVGKVQHIMCIHTENERVFTISVEGGGRSYCREGFTSWFDAYDHGMRLLAPRSLCRQRVGAS